MMLPPDTDVNVSILERIPSSFMRRRAPRWKSAARSPPPDMQKARPFRGPSCGRYGEIPCSAAVSVMRRERRRT